MKQLFKIVAQLEPQSVTKTDGSILSKCTIVLQEIGGKYANSYVCTLLGVDATIKYFPGDIVYAALRFQHSEYQGKFYQDISVQQILKFNS